MKMNKIETVLLYAMRVLSAIGLAAAIMLAVVASQDLYRQYQARKALEEADMEQSAVAEGMRRQFLDRVYSNPDELLAIWKMKTIQDYIAKGDIEVDPAQKQWLDNYIEEFEKGYAKMIETDTSNSRLDNAPVISDLVPIA